MADARTEKQKVKEITDRLEEGLKELFEGEKYKSYLNTMSKFHNYSANNIQLIEMQCPGATYVAGYKAWQKNFERHVNRGERGIRILAPSPYKIKEEQEKIDPVTNEPVLDRDGMPVVEGVEIKIPAFRVVTVFDYSQTDGKELPGLGVNELQGNVERYRDFMEALARVSPVPIRYEGMEGDGKGYFIDLNHPIAIKEGMGEAQTAKTGVHEVAHAKLHAKEVEQETGIAKDRETKEVEAESIAYTVCQHFGIDTSDYSFGYIAGWNSGKEMPELKASLDTIRRTSSEPIKGIEAQLLEIDKERAAEQSQEDIILLVANTDRSQYDLLNVRGMERTELLDSLLDMNDDDRQSVEAYLERAGAWVTLLANERSEEVEEYHLDYAYNTDTYEITDFKALQEERERQELEDSEANREAQLLYGNEGRFSIYQLKDTEETRDIRFMAMDYLEMKGVPVSRENYTLVYTGELREGMSLEDIYTRFNIDHPADFTGHSLSVSDVIVLHQDGENTSYYVDSVGYREIPEFTKELSVSAEVNAGSSPVMEETAEILKETAEENAAAEPDNDKVSYYVIEDLSTWAENSPEKSKLERFDSLPEAIVKFAEYQGKNVEDKPDMARATFGFNVNGSEFDLLHVRNHENCLSLDFTHSKAAGESSRFLGDLQTLYDEVGFDKVRVHREMSQEEIKDFVKQRFEHQLKSSGLDDVSLYMGRFDTLYEQGKMENLMPTANQKQIVEDVPFMEWENPYIDTSNREEKQTVITLTVAECGEFHNLGEYHEDIASVEEAIEIFNQIPPERMNGIRSIGINIHTEGTEAYEDTQMDIVSGRTADLEILDYVSDITDNPKAVAVIAELIDKLPDIEVLGSLEKWQAVFLAAEIDQLSYDYDTYQYNDTVEDREAQVANIAEDIRNGNTEYLNDFLNAMISDSMREGITDIFGKGTELDDSEGVQTARKAKELLDKLAEYKPLAKIEELEECNYNMIDNVLNNEKPKEEKEHKTGRVSIKEKLAEKKAVIEQRDKSGKEIPEKGTEKKSEREI